MFTDADFRFCTHQTSGQGKKLLQGHGCSRCSRETGEVGAAAVELFQMVDVREARGVCLLLFRFVAALFVFAVLAVRLYCCKSPGIPLRLTRRVVSLFLSSA